MEQHHAGIAHAQIHIMPGAGHAPFWEDADAFNRRLAAFCDDVARRRESSVTSDVLTAR